MPGPDLTCIPQGSSTIKVGRRLRRRVRPATLAIATPCCSRNSTMLSALINRPQLPSSVCVCDSYAHFFHTFL